MDDDLHLSFSDSSDSNASRVKGEAFFVSLVLHILALVLVVVVPQFLPPPLPKTLTQRPSELVEESQRLGYLALPQHYQKLFQHPKLSAPHQKAQPPLLAPHQNDPKKLTAPAPENKGPSPESSPKTDLPASKVAPTPVSGNETVPPSPLQALTQENNRADGTAQPDARKTESGGAKSDLRDLVARMEVPGESIRSSLEMAHKGGGLGYGGSGVGNASRIDNRMPDFSVDQPTILNDTHGVDFGPWLRLIYFRVRDNWYAVIPEVIRSGMRGRVVIVFDVQQNGKIENLEVVRSSGLSPYDRAAISSLKLSEPLPGFPNGFTGDHISLQFTYLYNIRL